MAAGKQSTSTAYTIFYVGLFMGILYEMTVTWIPELTNWFYIVSLVIGLIALSSFRNSDYVKIFKACDLQKNDIIPALRESREETFGKVERFSLPPGMSLDDFLKEQRSIEQYLNRKVEFQYSDKNIFMKVFEKELESRPYEFVEGEELPIGHSWGEKLMKIRLQGEESNWLIAGEPGSGKSTIIRSIIVNLILNDKKLHLFDFKNGAELGIFEASRNVVTFTRTVEAAEVVLKDLLAEAQRRYELFYRNQVVDITEYNRKFRNKQLETEYIIVDEFSLLRGKKNSNSITYLQNLSSIARASGIHMIISTQRPSADVIDGLIKANFSTVLGLKTMNALNSRIIIDTDGLERLRGMGHGLLSYKGNLTELQCTYLDPRRAVELIKHTYTDKNKKTGTLDRKAVTKKSDVVAEGKGYFQKGR